MPLTLSSGLSIYGARNNGAGIAQLVEPYLAKVAVASSSLVSRSTFLLRNERRSLTAFFAFWQQKSGAGTMLTPGYPRSGVYR